MFTVSLLQNGTVSNIGKMRGAMGGAAVYTTTVVNNGNFSNFDLFVDNSVELGVPLATAVTANYIRIQFAGVTVIGAITNWVYINDGNTKIVYVVDPFSSARTSGMITSMEGLCERTFLHSALLTNNMQGEPFGCSDYSRVDQISTNFNGNLNQAVQAFEGINSPNQGLLDGGVCYILTVSQKIKNYLGLTPFQTPPLGFPQELQSITELSFDSVDSTGHAGGFYRGTPLRFDAIVDVEEFISQILSGCGFRTELPASGYDTQTADTSRQYLLNYINGGGQVWTSEKNEDADPIEAIMFINPDDIYNLYAIPRNFAVNQDNIFWTSPQIPYTRTVANLHEWGAETILSAKLLSYPWQYMRAVTSNGDSVDIIPQTHHNLTQAAAGTGIYLTMRYVGGDNPRLMGTFSQESFNTMGAAFNIGKTDWFTIRSYPLITLSINNSYGSQLQRDIANTRKLSSIYTNSRLSAQLESPIKQAYLDTVNGMSTQNTAQSFWDKFIGRVGVGIGSIENMINGGSQGGNFFEDTNELTYHNERRSMMAGNFISPATATVMGNDFLTQLATVPFSIFLRGASNCELFTASRYFETFGTACNCIINPLTNAGQLLGLGVNSSIQSIGGRTYYQFSEIDVYGVMPYIWKVKIKELFESGVYLYD